ncbi:unnamed protein product [Paramecium octaurelia]|uniref:Uncharacterized protein n=1 Tax=Paramecium octaurelia TaxID=43137 RepID=A0A8S1U349_PAROT|nr:unnamed protein product [Paramecium octaurelia]
MADLYFSFLGFLWINRKIINYQGQIIIKSGILINSKMKLQEQANNLAMIAFESNLAVAQKHKILEFIR